MENRIVLSALTVVLVIGFSQFAFADESFIAIDLEEFYQPQSKYNYEELTIFGFIEDYQRGEKVEITIVHPDESEKVITTFASKDGDVYTLLHFTSDVEIGIYEIIMQYQNSQIASASFEVLEKLS